MTGVTQRVAAFLQPVLDGDTTVEDETLTLPQALFLRHVFEVFQDAALEVITSSMPSC